MITNLISPVNLTLTRLSACLRKQKLLSKILRLNLCVAGQAEQWCRLSGKSWSVICVTKVNNMDTSGSGTSRSLSNIICFMFFMPCVRNVVPSMHICHQDICNNCYVLWRYNGHDGVSNHQPYDWLLNRLFRCRSKKTSKLRATGLCAGNSPGTGEFPAQMASNAENVSIWWRHHGNPDDCRHCGVTIYNHHVGISRKVHVKIIRRYE